MLFIQPFHSGIGKVLLISSGSIYAHMWTSKPNMKTLFMLDLKLWMTGKYA
jgi:hypothetical protein